MTIPLKVKIVERKKQFYDIGPLGFKYLHRIMALIIFFLAIEIGLEINILIFIYFLIFGVGYYLLFKKMYGTWLINYTTVGYIEFTEQAILMNKENLNIKYEIKEIKKIQLKEKYFQNYTRYLDIIYDGIGTIQINVHDTNLPVIYFLFETEKQYEDFKKLKLRWKQNGLSIWT